MEPILVCNVNDKNEVETKAVSFENGLPHTTIIIQEDKQWLGR